MSFYQFLYLLWSQRIVSYWCTWTRTFHDSFSNPGHLTIATETQFLRVPSVSCSYVSLTYTVRTPKAASGVGPAHLWGDYKRRPARLFCEQSWHCWLAVTNVMFLSDSSSIIVMEWVKSVVQCKTTSWSRNSSREGRCYAWNRRLLCLHKYNNIFGHVEII